MTQVLSFSTARTTARTAQLRLVGELDAQSAVGVCELIVRHLEHGRLRIRLDASQATSIDDAAFDQLAAVARTARSYGGGMTMCGVARERLFRTTSAAGPSLVYPR